MHASLRKSFVTIVLAIAAGPLGAAEPGLVGWWKLAGDAKDASGRDAHAANRGADLNATGPTGTPGSAARFDGRGARLEVPAEKGPRLGTGDFTLSVHVHTEQALDDLPGDILSQYDPARRRGFSFGLTSNAGVTTNQANFRNVRFGIDNDRLDEHWTDHGRPGNALLIFALAVHRGELFAGTCEPGRNEAGHVYRMSPDGGWIDCGSPHPCNSVSALAVFDGALYAGVSKYRVAGSSLPESENLTPGGKVYRYAGDGRWIDCGQLAGAEAIGGLCVFRGKLYGSSLYKPAGFFRYDGGTTWTPLDVPDEKRVEALGVFDGQLFATSYDVGHVFRFDGVKWTDCGQVGSEQDKNTQTYSFAAHFGRLYVGTWPSGKVYRYDGDQRWVDVGRLGEELEVMGMLVHNGALFAGTLPLAEVYRFDGKQSWQRLVQLDETPAVKYRRAWTMAEFQGRLFCGTLPSGKVWSTQQGRSATYDDELPAGWRHLAAVRRGERLELFVDGKLVARSATFRASDYDLANDQPLLIGAGPHDSLRGVLRDVRIYNRALSADEIAKIMRE